MDVYLYDTFINANLLHLILDIFPIIHPNTFPYKRQGA